MKKLIISIALLALLSGCNVGEHKGRIDMYNAAGESTGHFTSTANRPMLIEATDENGKKFTVDSRGVNFWSKLGEGFLQFMTLGLMVK